MAGTAEQRDARAFVIDTVVVAVTQLILRLRGLILLPLLVGLLGTAAYGVWAQVVAFAMFLSAFVSLNFHLPLVREIAEDRSRAASHYTTLLIATVLISAAVAGAIALVPGPIAATLLDSADQSRFIQLGLVLMVSSNVRILNVNLYRATGRLMIRSVVELAAALGELGGTVIVLYEGGTLHDVLVFMAVWNGGIAVAQSIHCFSVAGVAAPQMNIVKDALIYSAPLVPASLANIALDRMDRFVVGHYFGTEGVGIYAANYAIGGLVMMVQTPFQMTLLPKVSELWHRDRERAARYIQISLAVFMTLAVPFVVGVPIIADRILLAIGNEEIAADAGWSTFFIAAGVMLWGAAVMHAQVFYGARRTGTWGAITVVAAAVNLALNLILVPWMGVVGAAAATFVAYAVIYVLAAVLGRAMMPIAMDRRYLASCVLGALGMAAFLYQARPATTTGLVTTIITAMVSYFALLGLLWALVPWLRGTTVDQARSMLKSLRDQT